VEFIRSTRTEKKCGSEFESPEAIERLLAFVELVGGARKSRGSQ